jgi:hypothetical protein
VAPSLIVKGAPELEHLLLQRLQTALHFGGNERRLRPQWPRSGSQVWLSNARSPPRQCASPLRIPRAQCCPSKRVNALDAASRRCPPSQKACSKGRTLSPTRQPVALRGEPTNATQFGAPPLQHNCGGSRLLPRGERLHALRHDTLRCCKALKPAQCADSHDPTQKASKSIRRGLFGTARSTSVAPS